MAKNVYIRRNEINEAEVKYIEELRMIFTAKYNVIKETRQRMREYEELGKKLESIHRALSEEVLVPVAKGAPCLLAGRLVHCNEVLVPMGATYYARTSTADAATRCRRRVADLEQDVAEMQLEGRHALQRLAFLRQGALQPGLVEIIEEYDNDEPPPR